MREPDDMERDVILRVLTALLDADGRFWVQARERDGDTERLTVSYGGDNGVWFSVRVDFITDTEREA